MNAVAKKTSQPEHPIFRYYQFLKTPKKGEYVCVGDNLPKLTVIDTEHGVIIETDYGVIASGETLDDALDDLVVRTIESNNKSYAFLTAAGNSAKNFILDEDPEQTKSLIDGMLSYTIKQVERDIEQTQRAVERMKMYALWASMFAVLFALSYAFNLIY